MNKEKKEKACFSKKRCKSVSNGKCNKVFNEEELKAKEGIVQPSKEFFIAILRMHFMHRFYHNNPNNLKGVAQSLADSGKLFIKVHGKFKLMKFSSIYSYIHRYSKETSKQLKEEQEEAEKYKHKK